MTTIKKYYVMIPSEFSHDGLAYWLRLGEAKTLTSAQQYVNQFLEGLTEAEIWVSINGGDKTQISTKNKEGNWVTCEKKKDADDLYAHQIQYHLNGRLVSRDDFYKYGFQHEKIN